MKKIIMTTGVALMAVIMMVGGIFAATYFATARTFNVGTEVNFTSEESYIDITLTFTSGPSVADATNGVGGSSGVYTDKTYDTLTAMSKNGAGITTLDISLDNNQKRALKYVFKFENKGNYKTGIVFTPTINANLFAACEYNAPAVAGVTFTGENKVATFDIESKGSVTITYTLLLKDYSTDIATGANGIRFDGTAKRYQAA